LIPCGSPFGVGAANSRLAREYLPKGFILARKSGEIFAYPVILVMYCTFQQFCQAPLEKIFAILSHSRKMAEKRRFTSWTSNYQIVSRISKLVTRLF